MPGTGKNSLTSDHLFSSFIRMQPVIAKEEVRAARSLSHVA